MFACRGETACLDKLLPLTNSSKKLGINDESGEKGLLDDCKSVEAYFKNRSTETLNKILCFFSNKQELKVISKKQPAHTLVGFESTASEWESDLNDHSATMRLPYFHSYL